MGDGLWWVSLVKVLEVGGLLTFFSGFRGSGIGIEESCCMVTFEWGQLAWMVHFCGQIQLNQSLRNHFSISM